ncbi:type II toxin-antitoxin system HicA family toxin [Limimaricola litoreus]|uniref:type II toxin-antitoxin system HicA family toxin n=1 Tax=Limimaricola litoreus TaxID=2955316 RepID=UPI003517CBA6
MSRRERLLQRFQQVPSDFTWAEFTRLLGYFGYSVRNSKGSRRMFEGEGLPRLYFHEPHPGNILKKYQIRDALEVLSREGLI